MAPPIDKDKEFLDTIISLAMEIAKQADMIVDPEEGSDDPIALNLAVHQKGTALVICKLAREYRSRLEHLKILADKNGMPILEEIARQAQSLKALAERGVNAPRSKNYKEKHYGEN